MVWHLTSESTPTSTRAQGLSGTIPTQFGLLTKVTEVDLKSNKMTGVVPVSGGIAIPRLPKISAAAAAAAATYRHHHLHLDAATATATAARRSSGAWA